MVAAAALTNACFVVAMELEDPRVVISGAGAAGAAITSILLRMGVKEATRVTENMKVAAAVAIAECVVHPTAAEVVPSVFDTRVATRVAAAVLAAAREDGVARA